MYGIDDWLEAQYDEQYEYDVNDYDLRDGEELWDGEDEE